MVRCYNVSLCIETSAIVERLLLVIMAATFTVILDVICTVTTCGREDVELTGHLLFTA
jgi:hypothetical protein